MARGRGRQAYKKGKSAMTTERCESGTGEAVLGGLAVLLGLTLGGVLLGFGAVAAIAALP